MPQYPGLQSRWARTFVPELGIIASLLCTEAMAQEPGSLKPVVTIDGKKEPHKIPSWIAWRSFFRRVVFLNQKPDGPFVEIGNTTGIERGEISHIISEALELEEKVKVLDERARSEIVSRRPTKERLREMDVELQRTILDHRERLSRILKIQSFEKVLRYIETFVAPNIVVGEFKE